MKIALVHMRHAGTGGTERYLNQIALHLAARGDDVSIVCRTHEDPPHPAVHFVRLHPLAVGAAWRMRSFARAVADHVRTAHYDVVYGLGKTWSQDVIRLGGGCHATYLELAHEATLSQGRSHFATASHKHRLALAIEERALRWPGLRRVVVNSGMVRDDVVRRYGTPHDKIQLIYNGVDVARFHPRRREVEGAALRGELGIAREDCAILFLGSGYGRKGLDLVLAALPDLVRARPRTRLIVVGYDSAQEGFEREAARLRLSDRVSFLGGRRDVEAVYAASDLYVLPTHYDPFANTTLEALATGLPVITTTQNGASELIEEGLTGTVLAGAGDRESLLDALLAWTDPERLVRARTAARQLAERHPAELTARDSARVLDETLAEKVGCRTP